MCDYQRGGWSVAKGNLPGIKTLSSTSPAEVSGMKAEGGTKKQKEGRKDAQHESECLEKEKHTRREAMR